MCFHCVNKQAIHLINDTKWSDRTGIPSHAFLPYLTAGSSRGGWRLVWDGGWGWGVGVGGCGDGVWRWEGVGMGCGDGVWGWCVGGVGCEGGRVLPRRQDQ